MRSIILTIVLIFGAVSNMRAQEALMGSRDSDPAWERVGKIGPDKRVAIQLRDGTTLKGTLSRVDENGVLLRIKTDKSIQIGKQDILRISSRSGSWGAVIGLGVGAGAGAAIFAGRPPHDFTRPESTAMGALMGGLAGAITGACIGKGQTFYQTPNELVQGH